MAGPIYKLWMCRPTEAWYRMSQEERNAYMAQSQQVLQQAGGKTIVTLNSLWANKRWVVAGIEEFPDVDTLIQHTENLFNAGHYRLVDSFSLLGVRWPPDDSNQPRQPMYENPVFSVWLARYTEAWHEMSEEERNAFAERSSKILQEVGGRSLLFCASLWANEQWTAFGLAEFPSVEAAQRNAELLFAVDHFRYSEGVSILGTLWRTE